MKDLELAETKKFLEGDRNAFEWLFKKHQHHFHKYAENLDPNDQGDLVQTTAILILQMDTTGKTAKDFNFKTYFLRSLHNTFINQCRFKKRTKTVEIIESFHNLADSGPYEEADFVPLINHLHLLTDQQRRVVLLRFMGIKFRDIAEIMDMGSVNNATGTFRHARLNLTPYKKEILQLQ